MDQDEWCNSMGSITLDHGSLDPSSALSANLSNDEGMTPRSSSPSLSIGLTKDVLVMITHKKISRFDSSD